MYKPRLLIVPFAAIALYAELFAEASLAQTPVPGTTAWGGLGWGIGIATDFDVRGGRVANATVVGTPPNDIVRVTDSSSNVSVGFVFEAHYFLRDYTFGPQGSWTCPKWDTYCIELGHGPFVAVEVASGTSSSPAANALITAYALGWMVGLRHPNLTTSPNSSWNFGVGFRIDPKAQVLGEGIVANQPLPVGETQIRYKTEPRYGVMLLSSFSF